MRKKMFFLLFLILPLLLTACTNPQGGIGPSWDVTAKIPIKKGSEEDRLTVYDILGEDVNLEEGIRINLESGDSAAFDLGAELDKIRLTDSVITVPLLPDFIFDPDKFGEISFDTGFTNITLGSSLVKITLQGEVDIQEIELCFFDDGVNKGSYVISIKNREGYGLIDSLEFTSGNILVAAVAEDIEGFVEVNLEFPELSIESITCDVSDLLDNTVQDFDIGGIELDVIDEEMDEKIREELEKMELKPELYISFLTMSGLDVEIRDLALIFQNLLEVEVERINAELVPVEETDSRQVQKVKNLDNIWGLLLNPDVANIKIEGNYEIAGENVTVNKDSKVGLESIELSIPYEFIVTEDMEIQTDPEEVDSLDEDTKKLLKSNLKAVLVIEDLNNDFPFSATMELYIGSISENYSVELIEQNLYVEENMIKRIPIKQRTRYETFTVEFESKDLEILEQKNLYSGIKLIIPKNSEGESYKLNADDEFTFNRIYIGLTGKINK